VSVDPESSLEPTTVLKLNIQAKEMEARLFALIDIKTDVTEQITDCYLNPMAQR
jgi:hypothetical protein